MNKTTLLSLGAIAAATLTSQAALTWTGGGDGVSLFSEANFQDNGGGTPAAGTIDPNVAVTASTGGLIQINSGTGSPSNFGGNFDIGVGNDLEVGGGKTLGGSGGIRVDGATNIANQTMTISGASTVNVLFILDFDITVSGASTLRFNGGGNPVNNTTTGNFLDDGSVLQFNSETYADFNTEHASKFTFNGASLVFGSDPLVAEPGDNAIASAFNGANGVQINFIAVPEPSSTALLGLGGLALILRRRK